MIELERRYLVAVLPNNLKSFPSKEVYDLYIPKDAAHSYLRVRKNGDKYLMEKKKPIDGDNNKLEEQQIVLSQEEFDVLKTLPGKVLHKIRYFYKVGDATIEIGIFQGDLKGLVMADVEFTSEEQMVAFNAPNFLYKEVHDEEFAGGWLCGKSLDDLQETFKKHDYKPLI